jgi:hypothetical protein
MRSAIVALLSAALSTASHAQTDVPKERIPASASAEIRREIERLYWKTTDVVHAAGALGEMGEKAAPAIPFLIVLFHGASSLECVQREDEDASVQKSAVFGLVDREEPRAYDALVKALASPESGVRNGACQALGELKESRAIEPLVAVVAGDSDKDGRRWQESLARRKTQ